MAPAQWSCRRYAHRAAVAVTRRAQGSCATRIARRRWYSSSSTRASASLHDPFCRTLLAYSVLLSGAYTREDRPLPEQYRSEDSEARLRVLREVAREVGATPNQVVLAWMLHSDPPVLPLIAVSTPEQMVENLGALEVRLSAEQMDRLNQAGA